MVFATSMTDKFATRRTIFNAFYWGVSRRFSTIVLFGATAAIFYEYAVDKTTRAIYESKNPGKYWKDVRKTLPRD